MAANFGSNIFHEAIFKIPTGENGEKPKIWMFITQLLFVISLQYLPLNICILRSKTFINYLQITCCSKTFKIHHGYQSWPILAATKMLLLHKLIWNNLYCHKHAKTNRFSLLYGSLSYTIMLILESVGYMDHPGSFSNYRPWNEFPYISFLSL